jgi:hypothetical protein
MFVRFSCIGTFMLNEPPDAVKISYPGGAEVVNHMAPKGLTEMAGLKAILPPPLGAEKILSRGS